MSTSAVILADSISEDGARLTTFQVRAPRFILPQLSKHRALSISCRSSRAVPVSRMIGEVESDPVIPRFGRNAKGMQAREEVSGYDAEDALKIWLEARYFAVSHAKELAGLGVAKEVVNRLLEPFGWFDAVVSATSFDNFFALRIHPDSQAEIRELAILMARAYRDSTPVARPADDEEEAGWHLPYVTPDDRRSFGPDPLVRLSAARCARVSYRPHDADRPDVAKDFERADLLERSSHWVPFEHQATPALYAKRSGNFSGWIAARQRLPVNVHTSFDFSVLDREVTG